MCKSTFTLQALCLAVSLSYLAYVMVHKLAVLDVLSRRRGTARSPSLKGSCQYWSAAFPVHPHPFEQNMVDVAFAQQAGEAR